ncbi:MAG: amidohydrolase family protein [Reichenbachiella sp.]|uniref:amidohydrolase family protein n=1 Tax=Reichenbachiella sp. TaxID=2184521 RepID=UPI003297DC3C
MRKLNRRNFLVNAGLSASGALLLGSWPAMASKYLTSDVSKYPLGKRVIDAHIHVHAETIDRAIRVMDQNYIVFGNSIGLTKNDFNAFAKAYLPFKDRLGAMYRYDWTPWQSSAKFIQSAPDELEAAVEKGALGVKIWKDLGLTVKDEKGQLVAIDDERLMPIWERAEKLNCIVAFHTVDPVAFFEPWNEHNERWEELELHPDWSFADQSKYPSRTSVLEQRNNVIKAFPNLKFQCVHMANYSENFDIIDNWMQEMPNMMLDTSARLGELGRQDPAVGKAFFEKYQDRIMFGTDRMFRPDGDVQGAGPKKYFTKEEDNRFYEAHWRYFQTESRGVDHPTPIQGNWDIDGIGLDEQVVKKIYWDNAYQYYNLKSQGV